jgi:hypothetical protein
LFVSALARVARMGEVALGEPHAGFGEMMLARMLRYPIAEARGAPEV